jgi:hypothetical protein
VERQMATGQRRAAHYRTRLSQPSRR